MNVNIYINGYGAPKNPTDDGNMKRYLGKVKEYIEAHPYTLFRLFLAGGFTNRLDLSEARAMQMWFEYYGLPENVLEVILLDKTTTARGNLVHYSNIVRAGTIHRNEPSIFFWEYSRRFQMKFFVRRLLNKGNFLFCNIPFDARSMKLRNRLKQYFWKFPLEVLSWYFPSVHKYISKPLHKRYVEKCRREEYKGDV